MEKTFNQLIDLVLGAVPTMVILVILYVFLRIVFFGPLQKLLKERHDATEGRQKEAAKSIAAAESKAGEYTAAFEQARAATLRAREAARQEALQARAALVATSRAAAAERIQAALTGIESDVTVAREQLGRDSEQLAESITEAILQ
jgi:F-type H+-transporting ATPase subunit b